MFFIILPFFTQTIKFFLMCRNTTGPNFIDKFGTLLISAVARDIMGPVHTLCAYVFIRIINNQYIQGVWRQVFDTLKIS